MTVLINYTAGSSKLILDVQSLEDSEGFLQIGYSSGVEIIPCCRISGICVSINWKEENG